MAIESPARPLRPQPARGFESEPADEWREDYGRGGPVRSNEPERDWFFEQNVNGDSAAQRSEGTRAASVARAAQRKTKVSSREVESFRGRGPIGYRPRDERIQELLCERLTEDPRVDASEIEIEVDCAIVKVRGSVPSEAMKKALLATIRSSLGVIGVLDDVEITARRQQ